MILSVSRRTDIPAFYGDWFFNRLKEGFVYVRNPTNRRQVSRIDLDPENVDCIVFWTKNPENFIDRLHLLKGYEFYFQFTLTPYDKDIERNLPDKEEVIKTFIELSKRIGKERVIWRYDPVILNEELDIDYHKEAFGKLADKLSGYTETCVISFLDIYSKTKRRMKKQEEIKEKDMTSIAGIFSKIAKKTVMKLTTCSEKIDLSGFGIRHGSCIDSNLISKLIGWNLKVKKDLYQREQCNCVSSIDIGTYNTCSNGCLYCYANFDDKRVCDNKRNHDPASPMLIGNLESGDSLTVRKMYSLKEKQLGIFDF